MHLYNIYINQQTGGIQVKVGDRSSEALVKGDKHQASKDVLVGYLSARHRAEAVKIVHRIIATAIANNGRIMKRRNNGEPGNANPSQ